MNNTMVVGVNALAFGLNSYVFVTTGDRISLGIMAWCGTVALVLLAIKARRSRRR